MSAAATRYRKQQGSAFDLRVEALGTLDLFWPLTPAGRAWLRENTSGEATWYGDALVVERPYVDDLVQGAMDGGLGVRRA